MSNTLSNIYTVYDPEDPNFHEFLNKNNGFLVNFVHSIAARLYEYYNIKTVGTELYVGGANVWMVRPNIDPTQLDLQIFGKLPRLAIIVRITDHTMKVTSLGEAELRVHVGFQFVIPRSSQQPQIESPAALYLNYLPKNRDDTYYYRLTEGLYIALSAIPYKKEDKVLGYITPSLVETVHTPDPIVTAEFVVRVGISQPGEKYSKMELNVSIRADTTYEYICNH